MCDKMAISADIQFAKSHEKFELVSSSLSSARNTGLKTRRYIRMISRQSLRVWNESNFNFMYQVKD